MLPRWFNFVSLILHLEITVFQQLKYILLPNLTNLKHVTLQHLSLENAKTQLHYIVIVIIDVMANNSCVQITWTELLLKAKYNTNWFSDDHYTQLHRQAHEKTTGFFGLWCTMIQNWLKCRLKLNLFLDSFGF